MARSINITHTAAYIRTSSGSAVKQVKDALIAKAVALGLSAAAFQAYPTPEEGDPDHLTGNVRGILDFIDSVEPAGEAPVAPVLAEGQEPSEEHVQAKRAYDERLAAVETLGRLWVTAAAR